MRADLRRQGVAATQGPQEKSTLFKSGGKVTAEDIALFSRQLATMLTAGIPLVQSFDIVGAGHDKPAMQKLILAIKSRRRVRQRRCTRRWASIRCISTTCS